MKGHPGGAMCLPSCGLLGPTGAAKHPPVPTSVPAEPSGTSHPLGRPHHVCRKGRLPENLTHIPLHRGVDTVIWVAKRKGWNLAREEGGPSEAVWRVFLVVAKLCLSKRPVFHLYNARSLESHGDSLENCQGSRVRRRDGDGAEVRMGRPREGHRQQCQWESQASAPCPLASSGLSPGYVGEKCLPS